MTKELLNGMIAAFENRPSANFSAEEVNDAAITAILNEVGLDANPTARDIRAHENEVFALVEEAVDEILPKKLENALGQFTEIRSFARDAEVVFDIEKVGKGRAKLTISKGARGGIYRAARLDNRFFSPATSVYTVSVYVTLEELILGSMSLSELFNNILEGFEEIIYQETFKALATGTTMTGEKITPVSTTKKDLGGALDKVLPKVKQYGVPTIFGCYSALSNIYNPLANTAAGYINTEDSLDIRNNGFVQVYKGVRVIELPNYLVNLNEEGSKTSEKIVFVLPAGAKPVKVALKGDMTIIKNTQAVGSEKMEAHKIMGVGVAMANNYAVIELSD